MTVEYCAAANNNSYAPETSGCPSPNHWVSSPTGNQRVPDGTYKVRVTVRSTISTIFGGVVGKSSTSSVGQATAVILGVCPQLVATGSIWPVTLWDGQDFGSTPGHLFQLWSPNAPQAPNADNNWKNVIDLSAASIWCNGQSTDYPWGADSSFASMSLSARSAHRCRVTHQRTSMELIPAGTAGNTGPIREVGPVRARQQIRTMSIPGSPPFSTEHSPWG